MTVDTLRPDALGWVSGSDLTPHLDALAEGGLRFPAALAPTPITLPSHTTIFTGLIPRRHGVRDNGQVVAPGRTTLAERLQAIGYRTAAFVSGYPLAQHFGLDQGFDTYDDRGLRGMVGERPATETVTAALRWLETDGGTDAPWFLWIHLYDPHDPYVPPEEFRQAGEHGDYLGEVAAVDAALGPFFAAVESAAHGREVLTLFASDHGESLGEHGEETHGFFLYQSTMTVPIVVHWPGRIEPGQGARRGALVDLTPTLLDLLGLEAEGLDGHSLLVSSERPIYLETRRPWYSYGWSPLRGVVEGDWKLIAAPRPELYDLARDREERLDRVDDERRRARALQRSLRAIEALPAAAIETSVDSETEARLAALGYVGGGRPTEEIPAIGLADPKDRIDLWNRLGAAESARLSGDVAAALAEYDQVLRVEPANPFALSRSGALLAESTVRAEVETGLARLRQALDENPTDGESWAGLAGALGRAGDWVGSAEAWQEVIRLRPRQPSAWIGLANALGVSGRRAEAVSAFQRLVELDPGEADYRLRLGFARVAAGELAAAAADLEVAAGLLGDAFQHAGALGVLLARSGQPAEAVPWLRRSRPTESDFATARVLLARLSLAAGDVLGARRALLEAVAAQPSLATRLADDPELAPYLPN